MFASYFYCFNLFPYDDQLLVTSYSYYLILPLTIFLNLLSMCLFQFDVSIQLLLLGNISIYYSFLMNFFQYFLSLVIVASYF